MVIDFMQARDVEAVARLASQLGYESTPDQIEYRWRGIHERTDQAVFVVRERADAEPIAWLHVAVRQGLANHPWAEITGLVVDKNLRGQGMGKQLMAKAEAWAASQGLPGVRLSSNAIRAEAHRFYEYLGYEKVKTSHLFVKSFL